MISVVVIVAVIVVAAATPARVVTVTVTTATIVTVMDLSSPIKKTRYATVKGGMRMCVCMGQGQGVRCGRIAAYMRLLTVMSGVLL